MAPQTACLLYKITSLLQRPKQKKYIQIKNLVVCIKFGKFSQPINKHSLCGYILDFKSS